MAVVTTMMTINVMTVMRMVKVMKMTPTMATPRHHDKVITTTTNTTSRRRRWWWWWWWWWWQRNQTQIKVFKTNMLVIIFYFSERLIARRKKGIKLFCEILICNYVTTWPSRLLKVFVIKICSKLPMKYIPYQNILNGITLGLWYPNKPVKWFWTVDMIGVARYIYDTLPTS